MKNYLVTYKRRSGEDETTVKILLKVVNEKALEKQIIDYFKDFYGKASIIERITGIPVWCASRAQPCR